MSIYKTMDAFVFKVCQQFTKDKSCEITALGQGLINDTFLVKSANASFVLQRINPQVFSKPELIMENLILLNQHIRQKESSAVRLQIPLVVNTLDNQPYFMDENNDCWRALEFFADTESKEFLVDDSDAEQVGFALAHFHCLLSDMGVDLLHDTLPGFHITPEYFKHYQSVEKQVGRLKNSDKLQFCRNFIVGFKAKINVLEQAKKEGLLMERVTHGDPKLNNFLFDKKTNKIISLVDLDTVKPGLVHYDIADCLQSCCHNITTNEFDIGRCGTFLNSYLKQAGIFFTKQDYQFLYPAIELIPFELGLRFLTDYLQGSQYFKVDYPEQNLDRAIIQFRLCKSIGKQEKSIRQLIAGSEASA